MSAVTKIAPVNSLVFISDVQGGDPPDPIWGAQVLSTPTCISVICFPEQDGLTELSLGQFSEVGLSSVPVFDGDLQTPSRVVRISTVDDLVVADANTNAVTTRVRIWLSHPQWPEKVIVALG